MSYITIKLLMFAALHLFATHFRSGIRSQVAKSGTCQCAQECLVVIAQQLVQQCHYDQKWGSNLTVDKNFRSLITSLWQLLLLLWIYRCRCVKLSKVTIRKTFLLYITYFFFLSWKCMPTCFQFLLKSTLLYLLSFFFFIAFNDVLVP